MAPSESSWAVGTMETVPSRVRPLSTPEPEFTTPVVPILRRNAKASVSFTFPFSQKRLTTTLNISTRLGLPLHSSGTIGRVTTTPTPTQVTSRSSAPTITAIKGPGSRSPAKEHIRGNTGGIVAGVLIAVLAIIVGFWFCWHRRRRLGKSITNEPRRSEPRLTISRFTSFNGTIPFRIFRRKKRSSSATPRQLVDLDPETGVISTAQSFEVEKSLRKQELRNPFRDPNPAEDSPGPDLAPSSAQSSADMNVSTTNPLERIQHLAGQLGVGSRGLRDGDAESNVLSEVDRARLDEIRLMAERMVSSGVGGDGNNEGHGSGGTSDDVDVGVGVDVDAGDDSREDFLLSGQSVDWRDLLPPPPYRE